MSRHEKLAARIAEALTDPEGPMRDCPEGIDYLRANDPAEWIEDLLEQSIPTVGRCHRGHESLLALWNCPVCTDRTTELVVKLKYALAGLGSMPDGYCFCPENRDPQKPEMEHTGECREARKALAEYECDRPSATFEKAVTSVQQLPGLPWRYNGRGAIVSDQRPERPGYSEACWKGEREYYGGYIVAESVPSDAVGEALADLANHLHQLITVERGHAG